MKRALALGSIAVTAACAGRAPRPFPLRAPFAVDTDTAPVSVPCRPDPSTKEPDRVTCAPAEYFSPFRWDRIDNTAFGPLSRMLSVELVGEADNANSLDEVADSSWFQNRLGAGPVARDRLALGACLPDDKLPDEVADGAWVVDHGKDNGSTPGFRVTVPGKGQYLLKPDEVLTPERASAASVIGAALYHAAGFNTSCEQIVRVRRAQLTLAPGLATIGSDGVSHPFDEAALAKVLGPQGLLATGTRMQASKWLPGLPIGPFRYEGRRDDDPNDIIDHEDRRELRGSRLLAAWMNHWDSREQNSMDLWIASDAKNKRSSPGYVRHYILDTSDVFGQHIDSWPLASRLGFSYIVDLPDAMLDFVTVGALDRPWDRAHVVPGRETFGLFSADDFEPDGWKGLYPNPAFERMTERDGAWMARIIARFDADDLRAIIDAGEWSDPSNAAYLTEIMLARQRAILERYLTRLSPLADVHAVGADQLCAVDLARARRVLPPERYHYAVVERGAGQVFALPVTTADDGALCFQPRPLAAGELPDDDAGRIVIFAVDNGTGAGPLEIHAYDLGPRGMRVVGLVRPAP